MRGGSWWVREDKGVRDNKGGEGGYERCGRLWEVRRERHDGDLSGRGGTRQRQDMVGREERKRVVTTV